MVSQVELLDCILNNLFAPVSWDSLDLTVEPQVLLHCQEGEDSVVLGAVADQFPRFSKIVQHIMACDRYFTFRRNNIPRQTLEGG